MSTLPEAEFEAEIAPGPTRVPAPRSGARRPLPQSPASRLDPGALRSRVRAAACGPWLLAAAFAVVYGVDSVRRYTQFRTTSWDLGLFTEAVKQYAHLHAPIVDARAPGFDLLGEHFHPILALLAPLFAIKPSPVTLLLAQAALFASSIVPVVSLARERLGGRASWPAYVIGTAYGASFGIVQAVDFDFHELAFAAPLISLALLALLRDRGTLLIVACVGLLCTKEEFGVTVVLPLGIAWALRDRTRWRRRLLLAAAGVLVSALQVYWLIPELNPSHVYGFLTDTGAVGSAGNVEGFGQFFAGFGTKLHLLLLLGLATGFAALLSPLALLAIPDLVMRFASSDTAYWGDIYHYNAVLMPILFIAAIDGLARRERISIRGTRFPASRVGIAAIGVAALGMLPGYGLGQVFGAQRYAPSTLHIEALRDAIREVPAGATVESDISTLAPLAARSDAFWSGNSAIDPAPGYVVYDSLVAAEPLTADQVVQLVEVWHPLAVYELVSSQDGVDVLRQES